MNSAAREALESRRQLLIARVALQRFELRSHIGALRSPPGAAGGTARVLRIALLAARGWAIARFAWRLAARLRGG